jgi:hypothetical protein
MGVRRGIVFCAPVLFAVAVGCATGEGDNKPQGDGLHLTSGSGMNTNISKTYGVTVFGGKGDCQSFTCGGGNSCSSQPYFVASSQRYGCGQNLLVTAPNGKSIVVTTADAGPAATVETRAGMPVLDSSPAVAQYLFGTTAIGAKDIAQDPSKYQVTVTPVSKSEPLGPRKTQASMEGTDGSGGTDSNGQDMSYAFFERATDRHHVLDLVSGTAEVIPFLWHDAAGMEAPVDLRVQVESQTVLQIASLEGRPFARAGFEVAALEADARYDLVVAREDDSVSVSIEDSAHEVLIESSAPAPGGFRADVVLPGTPWRGSIASDRL